MDVAKGSAFEPMLTTAELAAREDFRLGNAVIGPSTRTITGPGGKADVEPRVMQVLVVLADAAGHVVTRDTLFGRCWGSAYVGDDSLNRAVGVVRKLAGDIAAGSFEIETISRTGYRLIVLDGAKPKGHISASDAQAGSTRRMVVGGGVATAAVLGSAGLWLARSREDREFDDLMRRGEQALRFDQEGGAKYLQQAVAIESNNAKAWGLLAYALGTDKFNGPGEVPGQAAQAAERAARTALKINPNEPNALLAMTVLQSLDRFSREERYRRVLAIDPKNTLAMRSFGTLLHGVGRCRESLAIAERMIVSEPLVPDVQRRKAMALWVVGRIADADGVIDRAMNLWPSHRLVRMARLMIYAFTGRAQAASALVDEEEKNPILLPPASVSMWRLSLEALESRSAAAIEAARNANLDAARATPALAAYGILIMSALGELDAAFAIADGFLLGRGSVIVRPRPEPKVPVVNGPGWRNTLGLFTPPAKAMRLDPRFGPLCDGLGLTEYWRKRGIGPDAFLFKA